MDVRCERCRTQYVFGEDQVGPDGLTVRCSNCGHVFLVKKKALVVTVPVKPGELKEAPVATADLNRGTPPAQGTAAPRAGAEKARPWSLRNRRGDLYPFKDLSTLQKWIVERKAARDDEVSHLDSPWRRLGDMLELEPFFALVERAERGATPASLRAERNPQPAPAAGSRGQAAQPTLIDFPAPRPVFPGPGNQPAPTKTDRFTVARAGKGKDASEEPMESTVSLGLPPRGTEEGPVLAGAMAPVEGNEPAWTSQPDQRPVEEPSKRRPAARAAKRSGAGLVVVLALAGVAAAVYFTKPEWLGLPGQGVEPPKVDAEPPPAQAAQPAPPPQAGPGAPAQPKATVREEAPAPGTPAARPESAAPAAPPTATPPRPQPSSATPNSSAATAGQPPQPSAPAPDRDETRPGVPREERGQRSAANDGEKAPAASPAQKAASGATPLPPSEPRARATPPAEPPAPPPAAPGRADAKGGAQHEERGEEPAVPGTPSAPAAEGPKLAEAPKPARPQAGGAAPRRAASAQRAEPDRPPPLKRLIAEGRRLRVRGKPEAALRAYGRAIEVDSANADALAGRGLCYLDLSQYGPAEASFQAALESDARHAEALMGLAETYRYEGRRTEAVTYYQRYVAAHPHGEDAAAARSAIDALKE